MKAGDFRLFYTPDEDMKYWIQALPKYNRSYTRAITYYQLVEDLGDRWKCRLISVYMDNEYSNAHSEINMSDKTSSFIISSVPTDKLTLEEALEDYPELLV